MKPIRLIITLILFGICFVPHMAYSSTHDDGNSSGSTTFLRLKGGTGGSIRPHAPTSQVIGCSYAAGLLTIAFKYAEGNCEVALTDVESGIEAFYTIDSEELSATIFVGEVGELFVEISTENGNIYSGTLIP